MTPLPIVSGNTLSSIETFPDHTNGRLREIIYPGKSPGWLRAERDQVRQNRLDLERVPVRSSIWNSIPYGGGLCSSCAVARQRIGGPERLLLHPLHGSGPEGEQTGIGISHANTTGSGGRKRYSPRTTLLEGRELSGTTAGQSSTADPADTAAATSSTDSAEPSTIAEPTDPAESSTVAASAAKSAATDSATIPDQPARPTASRSLDIVRHGHIQLIQHIPRG